MFKNYIKIEYDNQLNIINTHTSKFVKRIDKYFIFFSVYTTSPQACLRLTWFALLQGLQPLYSYKMYKNMK